MIDDDTVAKARLMTRDCQDEEVQALATRFKNKGKKKFGHQHKKLG